MTVCFMIFIPCRNPKLYLRMPTYSMHSSIRFFVLLTPEIMHELIEKIVVHAPDKSSGHRTQEIEIHYRFDVAVTTAVADSMKYDKNLIPQN